MAERPHIFDDLAGVAGGAFSALAGIREETEAMLRARFDELARRLDLAQRADLEAVKELAANARATSEDCAARIEGLAARLDALEQRISSLEAQPPASEPPATEPPANDPPGSEPPAPTR
ncbi:MAG: accessory factor UbiK family protein [Acetobacteraceae bacterium]